MGIAVSCTVTFCPAGTKRPVSEARRFSSRTSLRYAATSKSLASVLPTLYTLAVTVKARSSTTSIDWYSEGRSSRSGFVCTVVCIVAKLLMKK